MEKMPIDDDKGQTTSELRAMKSIQIARLSTGPSTESATQPATTRPRVDAKFQAARMMTPISLEYPIDREKMGMKKLARTSPRPMKNPPINADNLYPILHTILSDKMLKQIMKDVAREPTNVKVVRLDDVVSTSLTCMMPQE
ncbi:hypothetical protein N0V92_000289 [Colletotrichum tropicale]|nr:hypothetical protein N0V92_000289 [Colletotrichum tropicale]